MTTLCFDCKRENRKHGPFLVYDSENRPFGNTPCAPWFRTNWCASPNLYYTMVCIVKYTMVLIVKAHQALYDAHGVF